MKVEVMGKRVAETYAMQGHSEKAILISISSLGNPNAFIMPNRFNNIAEALFVIFNNTESTSFLAGGITDKEAAKICKFINKYKNDSSIEKIIVQCEEGKGRSAGVAAAILEYLGEDATQFLNIEEYGTNMLCYNTVLGGF